MNKKNQREISLTLGTTKQSRDDAAALFFQDLIDVLLNSCVVALSVNPVVQMSDDVCVSVTLVFCVLKCFFNQ